MRCRWGKLDSECVLKSCSVLVFSIGSSLIWWESVWCRGSVVETGGTGVVEKCCERVMPRTWVRSSIVEKSYREVLGEVWRSVSKNAFEICGRVLWGKSWWKVFQRELENICWRWCCEVLETTPCLDVRKRRPLTNFDRKIWIFEGVQIFHLPQIWQNWSFWKFNTAVRPESFGNFLPSHSVQGWCEWPVILFFPELRIRVNIINFIQLTRDTDRAKPSTTRSPLVIGDNETSTKKKQNHHWQIEKQKK